MAYFASLVTVAALRTGLLLQGKCKWFRNSVGGAASSLWPSPVLRKLAWSLPGHTLQQWKAFCLFVQESTEGVSHPVGNQAGASSPVLCCLGWGSPLRWVALGPLAPHISKVQLPKLRPTFLQDSVVVCLELWWLRPYSCSVLLYTAWHPSRASTSRVPIALPQGILSSFPPL